MAGKPARVCVAFSPGDVWCRYEAEMAALDLDDLLQQQAAAERRAQLEAARNADLTQDLQQVRL